MIPILYDKDETQFVTNGLGRLYDATSATVIEERNGVFELRMEYPVNGVNYEQIQLGRIIAADYDSSGDIQPFDIVSASRPINGVVTFFAVHISYRQSGFVVTGSNINSLAEAAALLKQSTPKNPFSYDGDFEAMGYMSAADGLPKTVRELLGGVEGSILDTYGGEYKFDKFKVSLLASRGRASSLSIRYGVNMTEYKEELDISGTYSTVIPFWNGENLVIGSAVSSGYLPPTGRETAAPLDLTDRFETQPTVTELEQYAKTYLGTNQPYLPAQSIEVNFINLADSPEYEEYEALLDVKLCDTVSMYFPMYNTSGRFKVVKTEYDVLGDRFKTITLGKLGTNLAEALGISGGAQTNNWTPPVYNGYGSQIDITNKTSADPYICSSDGILKIQTRYTAGNYIGVAICNEDGTGQVDFQVGSQGSSNKSYAIPVFKGQKVWRATNNGSYNYIWFIPYRSK